MNYNLKENFIDVFYSEVNNMNISWEIKGLISRDQDVYAIGDDSKLLGRIFEIISAPVIKKIAQDYNYELKIPDKQNTYPDFTLVSKKNKNEKIAIDIKTTYKFPRRKLGYTLGSYTSFLRNGTKNIQYHYDEYSEHYVIGFAYTRNTSAEEGQIVNVSQIENIPTPYSDVEFFVRKKIDITGEKKGSGNTDNMGSISCSSIDEFRNATGPFQRLPKELYLHYWRNYPKNTDAIKLYNNLSSYYSWIEETILNNEVSCAQELLLLESFLAFK